MVRDNLSFSNFILPHINSLVKNSKDSVKSNDLIKVKIFFKLFIAFKELLFKQTYSGISVEKTKNLQKILDSLHTTLDIDNRFSESRCSKMVSNAVNYYKDNLPSHYTRETHERKLLLTLQHFTMQSRGPAIYKYIKIIQNECTSYWNNGHKMCEESSLTGNYCVNKIHRLPHDDYCTEQPLSETEGSIADSNQNSNNLPVMPHNSMVKMISACDCGRRQGNREDPFTIKAANYDFYLKMRYKCHTCRNIARYKFHVYDTNIEMENLSSSQNMTGTKSDNLRDSPVMKTFNDTAVLSQVEFEDVDEKNDENSGEIQQNDILLSIDNLSNNGDSISFNNDENDFSAIDDVKHSRSNENDEKSTDYKNDSSQYGETQSSDDDDVAEDEEFSNEKEFLSDDEEEEVEEDEDDDEEFLKEDQQQHSPTTSSSIKEIIDLKTLPTMIHTLLGVDNNLPARFSSWSLVCFGSSSIYSHNLGIQDQQGFVKGSHYLLPWNVTVILQHWKNMPPLWEGKRPPGIKHKKTVKDGTQFTVKIFIGVEYECFNGHRFIASKPHQILKANTYKFKETAESIAKNDMPLYMNCVCSRSSKQCVAQLMRIHIVTPKAPINVTLNPMIQVTPNASLLFNPGNKEPIRLTQSTYWVLRLPMIYGTDIDGPFSFPKEPLPYCRLLKGCYGIADQIVGHHHHHK
ncbi:SMG8-like protein [Euroglyphus maynei]|uniref:Nonsense-mediated mRNA decay factor SMG8 n=1 Tax=Euroglyphus maynei TaxID=6958 RepID=A0A1Y3BSB7_EURMA|nr:SMG8-like protein [Euroglyphus maynei]